MALQQRSSPQTPKLSAILRWPGHLVDWHMDAARGDELLVYRLTGSALLLGVVNFSGQAPTLLFTPFAGVIADRYDRHRLLAATQVMAMVQAALMAVLVLADLIVSGISCSSACFLASSMPSTRRSVRP